MIESKQKSLTYEIIESYDEFVAKGHTFIWCLIGNIVNEHEFGEEHEIKVGSKQFVPGAKVCLAPVQWGDGYEKVVVIGTPRHEKHYIEIIMQKKYIENFRLQKVYKPVILKRMCSSKYGWWGDSLEDRKRIIEYLDNLNPEEANRQRELLKEESLE